MVHCYAEALAGFRLAYNDYDYENDNTNLSAHICIDNRSADLANMAKNNNQ